MGQGVGTIKAYLDTPIPIGYVHLLCFIVKLYNILVTVLLALTSVVHAGGSEGFQPLSLFRTSFKAFFMPFLYNAIIVLNSQVSDPFGGDSGDFNFSLFDLNMAMSAKSFASAGHCDNLPAWISN